MKKDSLWTRDFILTIIVGFFSGLVFYSFVTTLAVYSMTYFGASEGLAGFTASIGMVGGIAGRLFAGRYMDRIGRRLFAIITSAISIAICLLYFLPGNILTLLAIRLFHGMMGGAHHNVMATSVLDFIPVSRRAEGFAIYTLCYSFALAAGPAIGMYIASAWSYEALWLLTCGYAVIGTLILLMIRFAPSVFTNEQMDELRSRKGLDGIIEKSALPLSCVIFVLCICYSSVSSFAEAYTRDIGIAWVAPVFFVVYAVTMMSTRPFAGRLIDRRGENFVFIPAMVLFSVGLAAFAMASAISSFIAPVFIAASACLMALGYGTVLPMGSAVAVKYAAPFRYGNTIATYFIFVDGGMGIGALVLGLVAAGIGFSNTFFITAAIALGTLALYWRIHGRHHRRQKVDDV